MDDSTFPFARDEERASGVSWDAVIGGAFVTAALSLILLALGVGLGLSSVSPWSAAGASMTTIGAAAIVWLIAAQAVSSSMGGYLAGRLRTRWTTVHVDEVYFRDTAHGFLAWAVAIVVTGAFLTSAAAMLVGASSPGRVPATGAIDTAPVAGEVSPQGYFVDSLFRGAATAPDAPARTEVARIFAHGLVLRGLPPGDSAYVSQIVSEHTGLNRAGADARVASAFAGAQQAVDTARATLARTLLWVFLALLVGAFCASVSATIGGRQRDHVVHVPARASAVAVPAARTLTGARP